MSGTNGMNGMTGYKTFESDLTCRGFQYAVGATFEENVEPKVGRRGFHFCPNLMDCFKYYPFKQTTRVAEVEALGRVDRSVDGELTCTDRIRIVRELPWSEVMRIANTGRHCTGRDNAGDYNAGDYNAGRWNAGNHNAGDYNAGDYNAGSWNAGNHNAGSWNAGRWNAGNHNAGDYNAGDYNAGDFNTGDFNAEDFNTGRWNAGNHNAGDYNAGDYNAGNHNAGSWNAGNWNAGNHNAGDYNAGDYNAGDYNAGDFNTGDFNTASCATGCFMTEDNRTIEMFNAPSNWTYDDWIHSAARRVLTRMPKHVEWIPSDDMDDEEKALHPEHETAGGYLKTCCGRRHLDRVQAWWDGLEEGDRDEVMSLPNFDSGIFEECTGIRTGGKG